MRAGPPRPARPPMPRLEGAPSPPVPASPAAAPCQGASAVPRVGVCPHLRDARLAEPGAGTDARRPGRARRLPPGSGQPAPARMAPGLAATPGRGPGPPGAHGLGLCVSSGAATSQASGQRAARAGEPAGQSRARPPHRRRPGRAGWRGARVVTARALGAEGRAPGAARRARHGGALPEAAAGGVRAGRAGARSRPRPRGPGLRPPRRGQSRWRLRAGRSGGQSHQPGSAPHSALKVTAAPSGRAGASGVLASLSPCAGLDPRASDTAALCKGGWGHEVVT